MVDPRVKWFRRLRRCISDMPADTTILIRHGCIELTTPALRKAAFDAFGHIDNCEALDFFSTSSAAVEPAGEGL